VMIYESGEKDPVLQFNHVNCSIICLNISDNFIVVTVHIELKHVNH